MASSVRVGTPRISSSALTKTAGTNSTRIHVVRSLSSRRTAEVKPEVLSDPPLCFAAMADRASSGANAEVTMAYADVAEDAASDPGSCTHRFRSTLVST